MSDVHLPLGAHRCDLKDLKRQPWRNGGGQTRELLVAPCASGRGWDWRVSVADIVADGAFSTFEGVDRTAAFVRGNGLVLRPLAPTQDLVFARLGDVHAFSGETQLQGLLTDGPAQLLNAMVRRNRACVELSAHESDDKLDLRSFDAVVLFVASGRFSVQIGDGSTLWPALRLDPGQGLCLAAGAPFIQWERVHRDNCLVVCALRRTPVHSEI